MPKALCDTSHMTEKQWLAARQHGPDGSIPYTIGGSDTAVVLGISPWRSPWELYQIKRGAMSEPPKSNSLQLLMGHWLEPVAASCYAEITGNQVINDTMLYQHNDRPYALANLDRRIIIDADKDTEHPLPKGSKGILECKSCSYTVRE